MCGIVLAVSKTGFHLSVENKYLEESVISLTHRGPDSLGSYSNNRIFMGHTRLSILDVSMHGSQPFHYENLILIYNGEIFNYREIRLDLVNLGYSFSTDSDTEVVIKAFHAYGVDCFTKFNGMWSLALYDISSGQVVVSRDRFGEKPLFFFSNNNDIYFASEISALVKLSNSKPNFGAIELFLKEGDFISDGNTFFNNIFEFPKASYAIVGVNLDIAMHAYWNYPDSINKDILNPLEQFNLLLHDSVKLRLRSDVGYCSLLSGGTDSTIVTGLMREIIGGKSEIDAYCYSSSDVSVDEYPFAEQVAKKIDINLHLVKNNLSPDSYSERLQKIVGRMGRGHSSPAIISADLIYEHIHAAGKKVSLDGQGADELLAGYAHFHLPLLYDFVKKKEFSNAVALVRSFLRLNDPWLLVLSARNLLPEKFRKIMRALYGYEKFFSGKNIKLPPFPEKYRVNKSALHLKQTSLNKYLIHQHSKLLGNLLFYTDIVSMNHSVENRSPFMDHRLIDLVFSSGVELKVKNGHGKAALREHYLFVKFKELLNRKKIGFSSPVSNEIKSHMISSLKDSEILEWPFLCKRELLNSLKNGQLMEPKYERLLFRLYQVHLWDIEFSSYLKFESGSQL